MGGSIRTTDGHRLPVLLSLLLLGIAAPVLNMAAGKSQQSSVSICDMQGCNCTLTAVHWLLITCAFEDNRQVVNIEAGAVPSETLELEITSGREVRFQSGAFSKLRALQRVRVHNVHTLILRRHAFLNLSASHALLELTDCGTVVIETQAFRSVQGPLSALISRTAYVVIQNNAFSWLLAITIKDVPRLALFQNAFSLESPAIGRHGPATTVLLHNVLMAELPPYAFPSSAAEVRLVDVEIRTVRRDAFCAITLFAVLLENTSLHLVEEGAFSERTLIHNLHMDRVNIHVLASRAVLAAITNLTIQHSRLSEVLAGAMNITVATVRINNNSLGKIRSRGIAFKFWNRVVINDNVFQWLEPGAFTVPFQPSPSIHSYQFSFSQNEVQAFGTGALNFVAEAAGTRHTALSALIFDNRFTQACHCNLVSWVQSYAISDETGAATVAEAIFNNSYCTVDSVLARCFNVPAGFVNMRNFTEWVCGAEDVIVCEELSEREAAVSVVHDLDTRFISNNGEDRSFNFESELDREKKVLGLIFIVVVSGMAVILSITGGLWLKKKGYCVQARILLLPTTTSCLTLFSRVFQGIGEGGIVTATSVSRLSAHEYTELQQQQQQQQQQKRRVLLVAEERTAEVGQVELVPYEDKWTQTLPEELTQELLQSLREKLEDPENYSEARDMIEHLYDLIKVEESCSNNNTPSTSRNDYDDEEGENLYDVIQQPEVSTPAVRPRQQNGIVKKTMCSVGTRAPSPDKLLPATSYAQIKMSRRAAVMCEYNEPKDRQQHLYTEVPAALQQPAPVPTKPSRPLSFLRAIGETLQLVNPVKTAVAPAKNKVLLLCEYAEPTDATVHVYSELPPSNAKMANRPLPSKPDESPEPEVDPGEGTSSAN